MCIASLVLLKVVREKHAAYLPSLYLDPYGEEDIGLRRGRPLTLSQQRLDELASLYRAHLLASQVKPIKQRPT